MTDTTASACRRSGDRETGARVGEGSTLGHRWREAQRAQGSGSQLRAATPGWEGRTGPEVASAGGGPRASAVEQGARAAALRPRGRPEEGQCQYGRELATAAAQQKMQEETKTTVSSSAGIGARTTGALKRKPPRAPRRPTEPPTRDTDMEAGAAEPAPKRMRHGRTSPNPGGGNPEV